MGDLGADTELEQIDKGVYRRSLAPDWEIRGPNGGYLAAVALRTAGAHSGRARPLSIAAHFLGASTSRDEIWTRDRRLVAFGGSTLLCRPATRLATR